MPTHVYQPENNPPSWRDRLLVHPMDTAVAVLSLLFGVMAAASVVVGDFIPSKSVEQLPLAWVVLVAVFLTAGGVMSLAGLNWSGENVSTGWALERFGWLVASGGLIAYGITVLSQYPGSAFSWMAPLVLGVGGLLRCWSILLIERHTRRTMAWVGGGDL